MRKHKQLFKTSVVIAVALVLVHVNGLVMQATSSTQGIINSQSNLPISTTDSDSSQLTTERSSDIESNISPG